MKLVLCHWLNFRKYLYTGNVFGMGRINNIPNKFARSQEHYSWTCKILRLYTICAHKFYHPPPPKFCRSATAPPTNNFSLLIITLKYFSINRWGYSLWVSLNYKVLWFTVPACKWENWNFIISHLPHCRSPIFNHVLLCKLLCHIPKAIIFIKIGLKLSYFLQKNTKSLSAVGSAFRLPFVMHLSYTCLLNTSPKLWHLRFLTLV